MNVRPNQLNLVDTMKVFKLDKDHEIIVSTK